MEEGHVGSKPLADILPRSLEERGGVNINAGALHVCGMNIHDGHATSHLADVININDAAVDLQLWGLRL